MRAERREEMYQASSKFDEHLYMEDT